MEYNKLVRDKIPEVIESKGGTYKIHTATDKEYTKKLMEKLDEEIREFKESPSAEEMADVLEVLEAICAQKNISFEDVKNIQKHKRDERGGFEKRIILESSEK